MDVNQYLARIQVEKSIGLDINSLARLQLAHLKTIPFENLDIHYGRHISLNVRSFFEKVVVQKRGGFCYELNGLFHALLREIGFNAKLVSARVATEDGGFGPEYDHLAIVVSIGGLEYLADVGFGSFSVTPLQIQSGIPMSDGVHEYLINEISNDCFHVNRIVDRSSAVEYMFTMVERDLAEFQDMCKFHQNSPDSHFTRKKIISVLTDDGRITLTDNQLKITRLQETHVEDFHAGEFEDYLWKYFGFRMLFNKK